MKQSMMEGTQQTRNRADFSFILIFPGFSQQTLVGIKILYFFTIFLYFSLNKDHKRCNHKNWQLQLRSDVVYRNSATWPKIGDAEPCCGLNN